MTKPTLKDKKVKGWAVEVQNGFRRSRYDSWRRTMQYIRINEVFKTRDEAFGWAYWNYNVGRNTTAFRVVRLNV